MTEPATPAGALGRLLLVDDDVMSIRIAKRTLETAGYMVETATDGREAVRSAAACAGGHDAILLDLRMPGMDGTDAAREIRRAEGASRRTPIIALTGGSSEEDRAEAMAAGMDDVVSKPIDRARLLAVIESLLAASRERRAAARAAGSPSGGAEPAAPAAPVLDPASLAHLRALGEGEPGFVADLIDTFLGSMPARVEAMRAAIAARDGMGLARPAHPLKSNLGSFGATRAAKLAHGLEEAGRAGALDDAAALLAALEAELVPVRSELEKEKELNA